MIALLKSLKFITAKSSKDNTQIINLYADRLFDKLTSHGFDELEYSKISKEYRDLMSAENQSGKLEFSDQKK